LARLEPVRNGDGAPAAAVTEPVWSPPQLQLRAGERALTVLATPLNLMILRALGDRPMRLAELRQTTGLPAQTTLRGHLASLGEAGALSKRPSSRMPHTVENELTPMGLELLDVADRLERWLGESPAGPISLTTGPARGVVKALVDGWGSTMIGALAVRPMSLTELDRRIADLSYPALERRLSSMRMAGLIEARPGHGAGTPYVITEWARRGITPLAAATRCERIHMGDRAAPVTQADIEAAFMLATPLVGLPADVAGACQLEVEADDAGLRRQAGVQVTVEGGRVVACDSGLEEHPSAFAAGSAATWFSAVKEGKAERLKLGGGHRLATALVTGLHSALASR
jgi:DNA-binding HxlR family transcriptional regulator